MYRSYLSLDLDFPGAAHRFEELHVPVPTIVTTNRANGIATTSIASSRLSRTTTRPEASRRTTLKPCKTR